MSQSEDCDESVDENEDVAEPWTILWMKKLNGQIFLMMQGIIVAFLANDLKWHLAQFWLLLLMQGGLYLL